MTTEPREALEAEARECLAIAKIIEPFAGWDKPEQQWMAGRRADAMAKAGDVYALFTAYCEQVRREVVEECARVADTAVHDWVKTEAVTPAGKAHQNCARLVAEQIRALSAAAPGKEGGR